MCESAAAAGNGWIDRGGGKAPAGRITPVLGTHLGARDTEVL
jgi:hypothetical protein